MADEVRHWYEKDQGVWLCIWCGRVLPDMESMNFNLDLPRTHIDQHPDSPPCTVGVRASDSIQTKDRLK